MLSSPTGSAERTGDVILAAEGLTKEFRGFAAVRDVNLKVHAGSIHALIGPNGAGKTTVFNLLTRFMPATRGRILYRGQDIGRTGPAKVARQGLVRSFQISAVFPHLTVLDNVRVALQRPRHLATQWWRPLSTLRSLDDRAMELLTAVQLADKADLTAGELSYGRKRALELATTLALDPQVLLLDEPMAGMGHEDIHHVADLIRQVAKGRTVLMVEHNLNVVSQLCDTITVLARGEILAEGTYTQVSADPQVREAYMGSEDDDD
ncbi:ABC transporter ATP-binding protein [Azorhizobium oxalatiphilum]|uniref:ABC transporter ATP-binding protein n=1 Tax=Azorhizobium oxalatiphilum TaxID=980631 RepID=A0A917C4W6_9HYPH|nr:ABC transporter ATP-binding protein [Azorhizobium oxalatiphilum]GGF70127.1 ABC transporter ATP-binding protein [Azorhizobium oxalatiphilum]